ncbi:MAG: DnaJ domain-containing protein [Rhodospirillales bacterium]
MAKRKYMHPSLVMRDDVAEDIRLCEWPDCHFKADYRAPLTRERLRDYRWFCLDHVREYNKRWNYYDGMTDAEVEADLRRDTVWQRPTWPIGEREEGTVFGPKPGTGPFGIDPDYFSDAFGFFEDKATHAGSPTPDAMTRAALAIFGLHMPINAEMLKGRYKELVKKHHPDTNGGTKSAEEKFKEIREAYETLRHFLVI